MQNIAFCLADSTETFLAVITAGIPPDDNPASENPRAVVKTKTAIPQRPCVLCLVPLEPHGGIYAGSV